MRKLTLRLLIVIIILFLFSFIVIEGLILLEGSRISEEKVDYVIVLGARLYGDIPSPALYERLKVAKEYLLVNKNVGVIVSGGQGSNEWISEASAMERYLVENGIEKDRIIVEDKSTSTFENLKYSKEKLKEGDEREGIKVLIATNKYHIFRAKFLAKRVGFIPYGLPAEIPPSIIFQQYVREYFAVIKSFIFDRGIEMN